MCPDEPQKRLTSLGQQLKASFSTSIPKILQSSTQKPPLHKPKILCQNPLDTQFPFSYIQLAQKRVLINIISLEGE